MNAIAVRPLALSVVILSCIALVAGCSKKAAETPPRAAATPPAPAQPETAPKAAPAPPPAPAPASEPSVRASDLEDVFFDFDKSNLRDDARTALDADAKLLRDHPNAKITIEGHCDERGTVEYNEALGQRRAEAAKAYLVDAGVNAAQVATISYGKDRPFCNDHNEACWAKNRCGHMLLQSGSV